MESGIFKRRQLLLSALLGCFLCFLFQGCSRKTSHPIDEDQKYFRLTFEILDGIAQSSGSWPLNLGEIDTAALDLAYAKWLKQNSDKISLPGAGQPYHGESDMIVLEWHSSLGGYGITDGGSARIPSPR